MATNHMADALTEGQKAADELARLVQSLEAPIGDRDQLLGKRIRELQEIIEQQKRVRGHMTSPPASIKGWQELRQEQDGVIQRTRLMTFEETTMPPNALDRASGLRLHGVGAGFLATAEERGGRRAADTAVAMLLQAVQLLQASAVEGKDPDLPPMPVIERRGQLPIPMQASAGQAFRRRI